MALSVTIANPKIEGLELMSPAEPEFDAAVHSLFKGNSDELLKLKPYLTILSNRRARPLVAYALKWKIDRRDEMSITMSRHQYPDAVAPAVPKRGNEILPGEQNIVAMSIEINCGRWGRQATDAFYLRQFVDWLTEYNGDAEAVEISIDAALFDDGEFLGPNESQLDRHFRSYVDAKQEFYRIVLQGLDAGLSLDEALAPIEAVVKANFENPSMDSEDTRAMWRRNAAPAVRNWRIDYGDTEAPAIFRRALRTEPFIIRGGADPELTDDEHLLSHVACPLCRLSPKSTDLWHCHCGNQRNTFDTRGLCRSCGYQWKETGCPSCGEMSPHADWYRKQAVGDDMSNVT